MLVQPFLGPSDFFLIVSNDSFKKSERARLIPFNPVLLVSGPTSDASRPATSAIASAGY